jgi:hypothetical protein
VSVRKNWLEYEIVAEAAMVTVPPESVASHLSVEVDPASGLVAEYTVSLSSQNEDGDDPRVRPTAAPNSWAESEGAEYPKPPPATE